TPAHPNSISPTRSIPVVDKHQRRVGLQPLAFCGPVLNVSKIGCFSLKRKDQGAGVLGTSPRLRIPGERCASLTRLGAFTQSLAWPGSHCRASAGINTDLRSLFWAVLSKFIPLCHWFHGLPQMQPKAGQMLYCRLMQNFWNAALVSPHSLVDSS